MKLKLIAFYTFFFLLVLSCKKKETASVSPTNSTSSSTSSSGSNPPNAFMGFFRSYKQVFSYSTIPPTYSYAYYCYVYLKTAPSTSPYSPTSFYMGTLRLNNDSLKFNSSTKSYLTLPSVDLSAGTSFTFTSKHPALPSFTANDTSAFPNYPVSLISSVNKTLTIGSNYDIPLSAVTDGDEIKCNLYDANNFMGGISKTVTVGSSQISLTPSETSSFSTSSNLTLDIYITRNTVQNIAGHFFKFEKISYSQYSLVAKP